jgi:hypothetical protein
MSALDRWGRRTVLAAWVLAVACSEGITPPGPATGSLLVTISGLAAGTSAAVTVTGPAGFTRTVTATETLSALAPGTYTIAAANVSVGNYTHQPTPATQAVAVAA